MKGVTGLQGTTLFVKILYILVSVFCTTSGTIDAGRLDYIGENTQYYSYYDYDDNETIIISETSTETNETSHDKGVHVIEIGDDDSAIDQEYDRYDTSTETKTTTSSYVYSSSTDTYDYKEDTELILSQTEEEQQSYKTNSSNIPVHGAGLLELDRNIREKHQKELEDKDKIRKFKKPAYVSEWTLMKSHDHLFSQKFFKHGLGVIPYKVTVLFRPIKGSNAGWNFPGDSAFQSDDDSGIYYGGGVYFYNDTHVVVYAPKVNNQGSNSSIIYTGFSDNKYIGNNHQATHEAYVQVKVWGPQQFPPPKVNTTWMPLDVKNTSLSFLEIPHGMDDYPALVIVQVYVGTSTFHLISDGVGSSVTPLDEHSANGGVVWGYDSKSIRIWTNSEEKGKKQHFLTLIGHRDGWGVKGINLRHNQRGKVRILAWSRDKFVQDVNLFEQRTQATQFPNWFPFAQQGISLFNDLFSLQVEAKDGANQGFRFLAHGTAQVTGNQYGGALYSYRPTGHVRIWHPNPAKGGNLIHIHKPYGHGLKVQSSNNAAYVAILIKTQL